MIKEAKGHKMLLSGDWGFKAGIGRDLFIIMIILYMKSNNF